jgi:hypothetical protein
MKIIKLLTVLLIVSVLGAITAGNIYLYKKMGNCRENQLLVQEVEQMKIKIAKSEQTIDALTKELKATEAAFLESHKNLVSAVDKLEDWVETSSVQGKWNGYKRQMGEFKLKMKDYYNKMKESIRDKMDSIRDEN